MSPVDWEPYLFVNGVSRASAGNLNHLKDGIVATRDAANAAETALADRYTKAESDARYQKALGVFNPTDPAYGAVGDGVTDDTAAFAAMAAALPANKVRVVIPPRNYLINGTVGFNVVHAEFEARGAIFTQAGTASATFKLNSVADATESIKNHNVRWTGGWFTSSQQMGSVFQTGVAYPVGAYVAPATPATHNGHRYVVSASTGVTGAEPTWPTGSGATVTSGGVTFQEAGLHNTNVGLDFSSITRGKIESVYGTELGGAFIDFSPVDGLTITDCHGYNNGRHLRLPALFTTLGDPQAVWIDKCGFSTHHVAGIEIDKTPNVLNVRDTYLVGDDSIVFVTGGPPAENGRAIVIDGITCEQGTSSGYYVRSTNPYSKTLFGLVITNSDFDVAAARVCNINNTTGFTFEGNTVFSSQDGAINLGSAVTDVSMGRNTWVNLASVANALVSFACARSEIRGTGPVFVEPVTLTGWTTAARATGSGTLTMTSIASTVFPKLIAPRAWILVAKVSDSGSAAGAARFVLRRSGSSPSDADLGATVDVAGVANSAPKWADLTVPCADNGNMVYDITASGGATATLVAKLGVKGYVL